MKWWFKEEAELGTRLPVNEVMERVRLLARNRHKLIDTINPDHVFNDELKNYVGTIGDSDFSVKRKYIYATGRGSSQSMSLIVNGKLEDNYQGRVLHLKYTVPLINLLWFLFPPLWMVILFAYGMDEDIFHGIPVFTLIALLLTFYLYWVVLAQFRRKAADATADFQRALTTDPKAFYYA